MGEIVTGDAERFRRHAGRLQSKPSCRRTRPAITPPFFDDYPHEIRICLDSPGGSFAEAMEGGGGGGGRRGGGGEGGGGGGRYARLCLPGAVRHPPRVPGLAGDIVWMIGTAVAAGARCEGACAILFMAGGHFSHLGTSDNVRDPNRVLHVDGRLVFRVPGPDALATLQRIGARLDRYIVPPSLFQRIMAASPDGMVPVDTVEQAASWVIQLAGAPLIADPSLGNLGRVCATISALSQPGMPLGAQYSVHGAPAEIRAGITPMFGLQPQIGVARSQDWALRNGRPGGRGPARDDPARLVSRAASTTMPRPARSSSLEDTAGGSRAGPRGPSRPSAPRPGRGGWMLFPGYTPLAELSALARAHPDGRVPGDTLMGPVTDRLRGWCATYDANDLLVRSDNLRGDAVEPPAGRSARLPGTACGRLARMARRPRCHRASRAPRGQRMGDWQHLGTGLAGRRLGRGARPCLRGAGAAAGRLRLGRRLLPQPDHRADPLLRDRRCGGRRPVRISGVELARQRATRPPPPRCIRRGYRVFGAGEKLEERPRDIFT